MGSPGRLGVFDVKVIAYFILSDAAEATLAEKAWQGFM
jgi:hypothetical protein